MIIFKATIKASFYVEAETIQDAVRIVDKAAGHIPSADIKVTATKKVVADIFGDEA